MKRMNKEKGFTIIELVVVILLLGILTATALPRFMDVTDEAHTAVVSGVIGGLNTGAALFRASWYATGQPNTVASGDFSMRANTAGYPIGTGTTAMTTNAHCIGVYEGLLQAGGRPTIAAAAATGAALTSADAAAAGVNVFVAKLNAGNCNYAYTAQFKGVGAPIITYDPSTGAVVRNGTVP